MRLLDQVAQAAEPILVEDVRGRHWMPGAADRAAAVAACPLRYILQPGVMRRCRSLLETDRAMFVRDNALLRAPAPAMWLEWSEPEQGRIGLLVEADEAGRSGTVEVFWEQAAGEPVLAQASIQFDFDGCPSARATEDRAMYMRPHDHPVGEHLQFTLAPAWAEHLLASGRAAGLDVAGCICRTVLRDMEMLFAFSALLLHRPEIGLVPSDLARINRQRDRHNKPALLDHVEVNLSLDRLPTALSGRAMSHRSARLHVVRGHMVHRGANTFWRRSHFRGDLSHPIQSRTVRVS